MDKAKEVWESLKKIERENQKDKVEVFFSQGDLFIRNQEKNGDSSFYGIGPFDLLCEILEDRGFTIKVDTIFGALGNPYLEDSRNWKSSRHKKEEA